MERAGSSKHWLFSACVCVFLTSSTRPVGMLAARHSACLTREAYVLSTSQERALSHLCRYLSHVSADVDWSSPPVQGVVA